MLMADTMAIFLVIVGLMFSFSGLWLLCRGLWVKRVEAAAERCSRNLWKPFLVGIPLSLLTFVLIVAFTKLLGSVGNIIAIAIFCGYLMFASVGVSGLATSIGQKLQSEIDSKQPWRMTLRGGIVLVISYLLPILGWFIILPFSLVIGCGAATLSFFNFKRVAAPAALQSPLSVPITSTGQVANITPNNPVGVS